MPLFDYRCDICNLEETAIRTVAEREQVPGSQEGDSPVKTECTSPEGHRFEKILSISRVVIPSYHRAAN